MLQITDNRYGFHCGAYETKRGSVFGGILLLAGGAVIGIVIGGFFISREAFHETSRVFSGAVADMTQGKYRTPAAIIDISPLSVRATSVIPEKRKLVPDLESRVSRNTVEKVRVANTTSVIPREFSQGTSTLRASSVHAECIFARDASPTHLVLLNELAWMGSATSASHEWMELRNNAGVRIILDGWSVRNEDGDIKIIFGSQEVIEEGKLFLLERAHDDAMPSIPADKIYSGALGNEGEWLRLFDSSCALVDEINASAGWKEFGGENDTKKTLERNVTSFDWHTSEDAGGTPRMQNGNRAPRAVHSAVPVPSPVLPAPQTTSSFPLAQPHVRISEVFYDAVGSDAGKEFVELYYSGETDADLKNWTLQINGSVAIKIGSKTGEKTSIPSNGYFLIGLNSYAGVPDADAMRSASLPNNAAVLALLNAEGSMIDSMSYAASSTEGESLVRESWASSAFVQNANPSPQNSGR